MPPIITSAIAFVQAHPDLFLPLYVVGWTLLFTWSSKATAKWPRVSTVFHLLALSPAPRSKAEALADVKNAIPPVLLLLCLALVMGAAACSAPNPACSPQALAAIEEGYISEVYFTCRGFAGGDWRHECRDYPTLAEKYRVQRDAWVRCQ